MSVTAVVEAAVFHGSVKLGEASHDVFRLQVIQPKSLESRRINEVPAFRESIEASGGRCMFASPQGLGMFLSSGSRIRNQGVQQCGFPHGALTKQQAGMALQQGKQGL